MRPLSLCYMYCILALQACLAKGCKIKKQKNCKTTNRLKQQAKNIKTVEPHVVELWNAESAFEISFKFNVGCNLNASKEGWLSALWRWISPPRKWYWVWIVVLGLLNRLSNSNIAWLKLKTCENKGDFPGDWQPYLRKCFNSKVSSLKNVAPLKAITALTTLFLS